MASTYTPEELAQSGIALKENFESGSTYTMTVTDKSITGASYLFLETRLHDSSLPYYLSGSVFSLTNAVGDVVEAYKAGIVVDKTGTTTIEWTPTIDVIGSNVYIKATGGIGVDIEGNTAQTIFLYYDPASSYSGTGTVLTDLSGNSLNGTVVGSPSYTSGTGGYFTMVDDYIVTPDLDGTITAVDELHSVEAWIYPTANGVIVSYQGTDTPSAGYHFSAIELVSGQVEFGLWNGTSISSTGGTGALTLNAWHQVVLTYDGTTCRGYIDGSFVDSVAVNWDSPMNDGEPDFRMYFGEDDITNQGDGSSFDGRMGVIRVYDKALSASEVLQNWNATKGQYGL